MTVLAYSINYISIMFDGHNVQCEGLAEVRYLGYNYTDDKYKYKTDFKNHINCTCDNLAISVGKFKCLITFYSINVCYLLINYLPTMTIFTLSVNYLFIL